MEQQSARLRNTGFLTFFFSGICAISAGVVVSLLQERYGFAYGMTGTLLSLMSVGNLLAGLLIGMLPRKAAPKPRRLQPVTLALLESPAGFLLQQRPQKGLLAGLWQPVLWEGETLAAGEVLARLQAMGLDTGTAAPEALPAAKHIFSHIEWHMNGILLHVPAQDAPAGCVWASREALQAEYTLPGAFKSYKKLMV